jgi:uncharacterized membrane protein
MSKNDNPAQHLATKTRYIKISNQDTHRVQGIKTLKSPYIYIAAIIFAFILYHIDRKYSLRSILST